MPNYAEAMPAPHGTYTQDKIKCYKSKSNNTYPKINAKICTVLNSKSIHLIIVWTAIQMCYIFSKIFM